MIADEVAYRPHAIHPVQCLKEGWALIKNDYWLFLGITIVGLLIAGAVPFGVLMGPMMCGIQLCLFRCMRKQPMTFDLLFKGFDYFKQSLIASLIITAVSFLFIMPFCCGMQFTPMIFAGQGNRGDDFLFISIMVGMGLIAFIFMMVLSLLFTFTFPLIVDKKLSGIDALKVSIRGALGNMGGLLGLFILQFAMSMLGMLACCVGAYLLLPLGFAAHVIAYEQVFREEFDEDAEPGNELTEPMEEALPDAEPDTGFRE